MFCNTVRTIIVAPIALCLITFSGCCTTIGFVTGSIIESNDSGLKEIPGWQIGSLKDNDFSIVTKKNGDRIFGNYQGLVKITQDEYLPAYLDFLKSNSIWAKYPALGDTIDIIQSLHRINGVAFNGFGYSYQKRYYQQDRGLEGSQCYYIASNADSNGKSSAYIMEEVEYIGSTPNGALEGKLIRKMILAGQVPLMTAAQVSTPVRTHSIPVNQIEKVTINQQVKWRWIGAGLGAGIDIVLLVGFMSLSNNLFPNNFTAP